MRCCGEYRTTRYCPDCGAELHADVTLAALLAHLRAQERKLAKRSETDTKGEYRRGCSVSAGRYKAWADELEGLLGRVGT